MSARPDPRYPKKSGRPRKYADDRTNTTIRIPPALLADLDRLADDRDVSRNWLVCRLLQRGVEDLAEPPPALPSRSEYQ